MEREIKPIHISTTRAVWHVWMNHHSLSNGNALKEDTQGVMGVGDEASHILNRINSNQMLLLAYLLLTLSRNSHCLSCLAWRLGMTPALTLPHWLCRSKCNGKVHKHNSRQNNGACRLIFSTSVTSIVDSSR